MKIYMLLNIVAIFLLIVEICTIVVFSDGTFMSTGNEFRKYFMEQEAKGVDIDEIYPNWEKRIHKISNIMGVIIVSCYVIVSALSVISVCLKNNIVGIILVVISAISTLIALICVYLQFNYNYRI